MGTSVIACCDAPPILELGEKVLDLVSATIEVFVVDVRFLPAFRGRDAGLDAPCEELFSEPGAVVALIGDEAIGFRQRVEHDPGALVVAHLAFREQHDDRPAVLVADGMELRVQSALGAPDTTGNIPFFRRLAAVRWAFRCVASIMMRSGWGPSPAKAAKILSNTPSRAPANEAVVERLMWPILRRCILPLQTIADHIDDTTDDALIIDTRNPMRKRKMRRDASHLALA